MEEGKRNSGDMVRPPCPECGSKNIMSEGIYWTCKNCKRHFSKKYRPKRKNLYPGISCPDCNSENVKSQGVSWLCKDCGRYFRKKYRPKDLYTMTGTTYIEEFEKGETIILR